MVTARSWRVEYQHLIAEPLNPLFFAGAYFSHTCDQTTGRNYLAEMQRWWAWPPWWRWRSERRRSSDQVVSEWTSSSNIQQPAGLTCLPTKTTTDHPPVVVPIPRAGGRRSHSKTKYFQSTPRRRRAKTCEITVGWCSWGNLQKDH